MDINTIHRILHNGIIDIIKMDLKPACILMSREVERILDTHAYFCLTHFGWTITLDNSDSLFAKRMMLGLRVHVVSDVPKDYMEVLTNVTSR